ncbi:TolC family protein [Aggregatimonas sangjinii]|uniref:TolC family protein n=1 Tax=Aggregatimonas sangjinii TaxID=2583587 RepID=A0A5B7SLM6_9FLAO|nr:TolC family protein [Aggregatimonas sangjinii]QCW99475.1 TolC family protein [Aggregatimonas sangjinii]
MRLKPHTLKIITIILIVLALQSCLVTKEYVTPEIEIPDNFRDFKDNDSISMAMMPWEELFEDTVLRDHINEALTTNYDAQLALQDILRAQAQYKQGKAGYLPTLSLDGSATSSKFSGNGIQGLQFGGGDQGGNPAGGSSRIEQYNLSGTLNWELDIWGAITSNKKATAAAYLATEAGQRVVRTALIANIGTLYYELIALDEQLFIARQTVEARKNSFDITQKLKEAGREREVAVQQAGSQLKIAELLELQLELEIKTTENAFSILLGKSPREIERGDFRERPPNLNTSVRLPSAILRNRPDVIQAEFNLINAFELTNVAKTEFYPKLTLGGTAGFNSLDASDWISSASFFNDLVAGITHPLLNNRKIRTAYEVAKIDQQSALLEFERTLLISYQEVADAYLTYNSITEQYNVTDEQVDFLENASNYSLKLYQNGFTNYLDVLIADTNLLDARISLINTRFAKISATIELYRALGGGWNKVIAPEVVTTETSEE